MVALVVAASENGIIGKDNRLPWHMPADLKHFKKLTTGHTVVMGRKTFESIGKALPQRRNIVVTRQPGYAAEGCTVVHSLREALAIDADDLFVIGGAAIYEQALPDAGRIYLTRIHENFEGDTYLFPIDPNHWSETERADFDADERNPHAYSFITYERRS